MTICPHCGKVATHVDHLPGPKVGEIRCFAPPARPALRLIKGGQE